MINVLTTATQAVQWPGSLIRPALSLQTALSDLVVETALLPFRTFSPATTADTDASGAGKIKRRMGAVIRRLRDMPTLATGPATRAGGGQMPPAFHRRRNT
jgi:hypothetical protein